MSINGLTKSAFFQERVRPMFRSLSISASGLSAQRRRIDVIATNIANAETTRTEQGGPYQRQRVELQSKAYVPEGGILQAGRFYPTGQVAGEFPLPPYESEGGVGVTGISSDGTEGPLVYDPSHPDANTDGYVRMPNVNLTEEIVDMMESRRMYEANATVFQAIKNMLHRATQI